VFDAAGSREGEFLAFNIWGLPGAPASSILVMVLDTFRGEPRPVEHEGLVVFDIFSNTTWVWEGRPITFPGNSTIAPQDIVAECDAGFFLDDNPANDLYRTCRPCFPGTFSTVPAGSKSHSATSCSLCDIGTAQGAEASTACDLCTVGTYQDRPGSRTCTRCQPKFYSDSKHAVLPAFPLPPCPLRRIA
jgi:hypothetical protein